MVSRLCRLLSLASPSPSAPCRSLLAVRRFSSSSSHSEPFGPPPPITSRRVVITGLGLVTPLGCGVEMSWKRLIEGKCGIRAITHEDLKMASFDQETVSYTFDQLTSKVAALVPCGAGTGEFNEELWLNSKNNTIHTTLHLLKKRGSGNCPFPASIAYDKPQFLIKVDCINGSK